MLTFQKYINRLYLNFILLLCFSILSTFQAQAQPPCTIQFSQCPGETTILGCPNSPNGFTLYAYPPVNAYLSGNCPTGASLVIQQTGGPTLPAVIPPGGYQIQYDALIYVNGQPTGQSKACTFQLFVLPDNQPPVFTYCPPPITVHGTLDNNGNCTATGQWPLPIVTDNCALSTNLPGGLAVNTPCGSTLGAGTHTITYTAYDSSGNSATCSFTVTVLCPSGTDDSGVMPYVLQVYPNPNTGVFTVELPEPTKAGMQLRITDLTGQLMLEKPLEVGGMQERLDVGSLPEGLYFLQVLADGQVLGVEKFVKQ